MPLHITPSLLRFARNRGGTVRSRLEAMRKTQPAARTLAGWRGCHVPLDG
ncbi:MULTISPECIES: hypothetical protein [unclassified Bradyrhizobium]